MVVKHHAPSTFKRWWGRSKTPLMQTTSHKVTELSMACSLILSSIAIAFYQVITKDDIANGVLMYIAQAFLLAGSIFGLDYYVSLLSKKLK